MEPGRDGREEDLTAGRTDLLLAVPLWSPAVMAGKSPSSPDRSWSGAGCRYGARP
jgi:hypothetical protein